LKITAFFLWGGIGRDTDISNFQVFAQTPVKLGRLHFGVWPE